MVKHTQTNSSTKVVFDHFVCLTILWGRRLKGLSSCVKFSVHVSKNWIWEHNYPEIWLMMSTTKPECWPVLSISKLLTASTGKLLRWTHLFGSRYSRMHQVKFVEDRLLKIWSYMVCLSSSYHLKLFKGCLPKILLGPFLNILTDLIYGNLPT